MAPATNGIGSGAPFNYPYGIACDTTNTIAYICDHYNYRVRMLVLPTKTVTTFAGNGFAHSDGIGPSAQFYYPQGIVYHPSGVLYVAEYVNLASSYGYIRKIVVDSRIVSTVTTVYAYNLLYLCINSVGALIFATSPTAVFQINVSSGAAIQLAGRANMATYADGVGSNAFFNNPLGIALNRDESALIIADTLNRRIRKLVIATSVVTTIAGN